MLVDELLTLGVKDVIIFDLHEPATASLFDGRCSHLYASHDFLPRLQDEFDSFDVVCSADTGAAKMAEWYASRFACDFAVMAKGSSRKATGRTVKEGKLAGDVAGKKVLVVDELNDSGGTLLTAADFLIRERGAAQLVMAIVHSIASGECQDRLAQLCQKPEVRAYWTTNSVLQADGFYGSIPKVRVIPLESTIAETIRNIHQRQSVGGVYLTELSD
jgi:ribose-phosphate pyrophosphokinase